MPYVFDTPSPNLRVLLSGLSNSGKTTSLSTFIFGPYDYNDPEQQADAEAYAGDKHMVILVCPGEFGIKSLPEPNKYITTAYNVVTDVQDINSLEWSLDALADFNKVAKQIVANKPDIFCNDGVHALAANMLNRASAGQYAAGEDLNCEPGTARQIQYRAAKMYEQLRAAMSGYCSWLYTTAVPLIVCTTWEDWKSGNDDVAGTPHQASDRRYLWPDIPGKTSKAIVGRFDMRLSSRVERRCIHPSCVDSAESREHFVWQFLPRGDVAGVGIKGLKPTAAMVQRPYIHQNWHILTQLIKKYS
jgi:hypothetical protein